MPEPVTNSEQLRLAAGRDFENFQIAHLQSKSGLEGRSPAYPRAGERQLWAGIDASRRSSRAPVAALLQVRFQPFFPSSAMQPAAFVGGKFSEFRVRLHFCTWSHTTDDRKGSGRTGFQTLHVLCNERSLAFRIQVAASPIVTPGDRIVRRFLLPAADARGRL